MYQWEVEFKDSNDNTYIYDYWKNVIYHVSKCFKEVRKLINGNDIDEIISLLKSRFSKEEIIFNYNRIQKIEDSNNIINDFKNKFIKNPEKFMPKLKKEYFEKRDKKEFSRFNILSKRKLGKRSNYKCRICNQSLAGEEALESNHIIPKILGGKDTYENLELLHASCHIQHHQLLNKYGGGKNLHKVRRYFEKLSIEPSSKEGIKQIKQQFKKFKYSNCLR